MDNVTETTPCIVGVARTPIGGLNGCMSSFTAVELGAMSIKEALKRSNVSPGIVEEVFMGNVLQAGLGQNPARHAAVLAGVPTTVPATTINKVCASGMKAVALASQSIRLGEAHVIVAGGFESMSNSPHCIPALRRGVKYGSTQVLDIMQHDGLTNPFGKMKGELMGNCGELCAAQHDIGRDEQDRFAALSYRRAHAARESGKFQREIFPVEVRSRRGATLVAADEESLSRGAMTFESLSKLKTAFAKDGTVTAGNASTISDGGAALVIVSGKKAKELNLKIMAIVAGAADAAHDAELFTTAPSLAIPKALKRAKVHPDGVDFYELNEAFSVVGCVNVKLLGLDIEKVNVYGGAVSLGHPLGCSGARILITLLSALQNEGGMIGCAGICNGGGGASAIVLKRLQSFESSL